MSVATIELPVEGLSDGRIRLRPVTDADIPAIVEACRDPAIQRYTTVPARYRAQDALGWGARSVQAATAGRGIELVVADTGSGDFLGTAGIRRHATDGGRWSVGYLVAPQARGRGVATAALRLLCRWAFEDLGAERIELCAEPSNEPSLRVAYRAGFEREGLLRSYQVVKGVRRDMVMFSLVRGELRSQ